MSDPIRRGGNRRRNPARQEGTETSLSIMNFRNQIQDLARPNLFQVSLDFPDIDGGDSGRPDGGRDRGRGRNGRRGRNRNQDRNLSTFLVKAANLPASTIGVIEVPFRGRQLKIAGDRTFDCHDHERRSNATSYKTGSMGSCYSGSWHELSAC